MRVRTQEFTVAVAVLALASESAQARTWRVQKDGSGDFTAIQPAINSASAGDTIEIGVGRYTENAIFSPFGNWSEPTYVAVTKDNLTLRGTDRDAVIIGPTVKNVVGFGPLGIVTQGTVSTLRVETLAVENVYDGMYLIGHTTIEGCLFRGCSYGIAAFNQQGIQVTQCTFELNAAGLVSFEAPSVVLEGCSFISSGLSFVDTQNAVVSACQFSRGIVGVEYERSNGTVSECSFRDVFSTAIVSNDRASVTALSNVMTGGQIGLLCRRDGVISGTENLVSGTSYACVNFFASGSLDLHGNDFLASSGYGARVDYFVPPGPYALDLTNNYWGVETEAEVAALIWDGADDPTIPVFIQYVPFAVHTVPAAEHSFGGLKARYGRGGQ